MHQICRTKDKRADGQDVSIGEGCDDLGVILHELGHVIGFKHEQMRPDRNDFVQINHNNIKEGAERQFEKLSTDEINSLGEPYDYNPIMHYPEYGYSKNGLATVVPKFGKINQPKKLIKSDIIQANRLYKCIECRRVFYSKNATFAAPNYDQSNGLISNSGKSIECERNIAVAREKRIKLNITDLMIFNSTDCQTDYLEIRYRYLDESSVLDRFCGTIEPDHLPHMVVSPSNQMIVKYVSTHLDYQGFAANYEAVRGFCAGDMNLSYRSHYYDLYLIESPNYPDAYPANKECFWRISVPPNFNGWWGFFNMAFETFDLESHPNCLHDFVEVSYGEGNQLLRYCNKSMPASTFSPFSTTQMVIRFKSDESYQGQGFLGALYLF